MYGGNFEVVFEGLCVDMCKVVENFEFEEVVCLWDEVKWFEIVDLVVSDDLFVCQYVVDKVVEDSYKVLGWLIVGCVGQ